MLALLLTLIPLQAHATNPLELGIQLSLDPKNGVLQATDVLRFPEARREIRFELSSDLAVQSSNARTLAQVSTENGLRTYLATFGADTRELRITVAGTLRHPETDGESQCMIREDGVVLLSSCAWYPSVAGERFLYTLDATLPAGWTMVTEGEEKGPSHRTIDAPIEGLNFVAGPFQVTEGQAKADSRRDRAFLRSSDPELAKKLLDAVPSIIARYEGMFGPYAYREFNIVENLYETGYGMPTFTLLGPQVLRFPFLLTSSFPHEILHNWWGNGVYVDYGGGNWSEGLTTYLADHLEQELQGKGASYRLKTLMGYEDYAATGADFPVRKFVGRHSSVTQAVGYGKSMMFFHMLRLRFGDELFFRALRRFYRENLQQAVGFTAIQRAFEAETSSDLTGLFSQWLDRTGAPALLLKDANKTRQANGSWLLELRLAQSSPSPYDLSIPAQIFYRDGSSETRLLSLTTQESGFSLSLNREPVRVEIDPRSDVMRRLDPLERPVTLSALYGAPRIAIFRPNGDAVSEAILGPWKSALGAEMHETRLEDALASDESALILGDTPEIRAALSPWLASFGAQVDSKALRISGQDFSLERDSFVLALRSEAKPRKVLVWIRGLPAVQPAEWAGRLLHYGSVSAVIFDGRTNVYQTLWSPLRSPLKRDL